MRILINIPDISIMGGVSIYYRELKRYLPLSFKYNTIGSRKGINGIFLLPFDLVKTILLILIFRPKLAVLNPSLKYKAINRDQLYLILFDIFNIKTIVFFRGWDKNYAKEISLNPKIIKAYKNRASAIIVLSKAFKEKLRDWGFNQPIYVETTKVANKLLDNFDILKKNYSNPSLLFLSRIEKEKGVYTAIDLFVELKKEFSNLTLSIVGEGTEFKKVKKYIYSKKIEDIYLPGRLDGEELKRIFSDSNIYLFPSQHSEGLPASVLEAMAFGCCIVTSTAGGLKDIIENTKHGFIIDPTNFEDLKSKVESLIIDYELRKKIGFHNHDFAKENFLANKVAKRLSNIIKSEI